MSLATTAGKVSRLPGRISVYHGFERHDFEFHGHAAIVVRPKQVYDGKQWIWRTEYFDHRPEVDLDLIAKGFHLVFLNNQDDFGGPAIMAVWDAFYRELTAKYGLARKVVLEGFSRGAIYAYNWAARNPNKVACVYADAPVCNFTAVHTGPEYWEKFMKSFHFKSGEEASASDKNPINNLKPLADAKIPILHVYGDADKVVPYKKNTAVLARRYRALGGSIALIVKKGCAHHPHSLDDPAPIVDFILKHAAPPGKRLYNREPKRAEDRRGVCGFPRRH